MQYRTEIKFICDETRLGLIEDAVKQICIPDPHAGASGRYLIKSLYFDTPDRRCYMQTKNGVDNRAKYRIRIYDDSAEFICLERKESLRGKKRKFQQQITRETFYKILEGDNPGEGGGLLQRFLAEKDVYMLSPHAVICYDRTPLIHPAGNVRITFDRNISVHLGDLFSKEEASIPVMPGDYNVLEVKYDEVLPGAIADCLRAYDMSISSYSKYVHGIDALSGILEGVWS